MIGGVARIEPDNIDATVRRHRERSEPVPFLRVYRVIIDPAWQTEIYSTIRAPHKHDVGSGVKAGAVHAGQHVDIVVGAGAVHREINLADKAGGIDQRTNVAERATDIDGGDLIESRSDGRILRVGG